MSSGMELASLVFSQLLHLILIVIFPCGLFEGQNLKINPQTEELK
jgi:hypothetical protein